MGSQEMLEGDRVSSGNENGSNEHCLVDTVGCSAENGSEDLGDELLVNLESYLDDINDRLTISRMVSNSVIKGMVTAVEQEAAQKIAAKELEMTNLKEALQFYYVDVDKIDWLESSMDKNELDQDGKDCVTHWSFEEACSKHDMMIKSLQALRNVADQQLKKLTNGIHGARSSSIRRMNSGSELVGLGGILLEKDSQGWVHVDQILDGLRMTVDNICSKANSMLMRSKSSLCNWYCDRDLQSYLEAMVMQSLIQSIQQEFEQKLWDQSSQLSCSQTINWIEKLNQISSFRMELDAILKSLPNGEGQLVSYGSYDADHFHRVLSNHVTCSTTHQEGNGKLEAPDNDEPESYDPAQLNHLSKEKLVGHFNNIITKMRRNHESTVQKMTEEYFSLKREYLKERGSSLPHKKDKEFDILRKKIPDVILKLDDILTEKEKLPVVAKDADNFSSLKDRLDNLLSENHHLRDSLRDKKNELKCMSSLLSDAAERILQHSSAEAKMMKHVGILQADLEDAHIEAAIEKDVQKCILIELIGDLKCDTEELDLEILLQQEIYDIIFSGATADIKTKQNYEIEDSDMESLITQGLCGVIFKETLRDAWKEIKELHNKYLIEKQEHNSFEMKALKKENELKLEAEQNERLKQKISILAESLDEKEKEAREVSVALAKEREQFGLASQKLDSLIEEVNQQRTLASESSKELDSLGDQLSRALEQIKSDKVEISKLNQNLEQAQKDLEHASEQRKMVVALTQEKHENAQLVEAKERELKMQIESVIFNVQGLSKMLADFEFKVSGKFEAKKLRIQDSFSELSSLLKKAKLLKRTGLMYKQKFERRCSDLQMAEVEVDLLGDEVDTLLNLLEKIYIALDHYSPVLQRYPGIIEVLTLIKRELSGESSKPV